MSVTIDDAGLVTQTITEKIVYDFDWGDELPALATILTSVMTATALRPTSATALTVDNATKTARATQLRLSGGTAGAYYKVKNQITTDEAPDQVLEAWFFVLLKGA